MRPADTWICVADGARAHFYRCDGPGRGVEPILNYMMVSPNHHHGTQDVVRFVGRLAVRLDAAAAEQLFEHLLLVAPAGMLGALRDDPEARQAMLEVFVVLGDEDPLVPEYRRRLASALF